MKTIIKFLFTLLILFAFSCSQESTQDPLPTDLDGVSAKASSKQTADIFIPPPLGTPPPNLDVIGTATLHRNKNGITVNYKATGLYPGAYTIWWVIWNNPLECIGGDLCGESDFGTPGVDVDVMYAGGHVVGNNGKGNFSAHLNAGDETPESMNVPFGLPLVEGGGLQVGKTFSAEVHVVLRTHGPAVPGLVNEQISSYAGGCDTPFDILPFTEYPDEIGQCADIAAAIFAPVN
ncbi:MAG: hypothetical protein WBN55_12345 [Eudoraea sp.]|uniref:hypothetical protein n=1 Tax=Eudoraea sp. TaxID=1979955 RepID=UPI003C730A24